MRLIVFLSVILVFIWAFFVEPNVIEIKKYNLEDKDLSGLKIVFVGDFHIGSAHKKRLIKIVELINKQNPDLVLSIGDFVKGHDEKTTLPIEGIAEELSQVKSKYGFYTVLGNHDVWVYPEKITRTLEDNGIKVLNNSNYPISINNKKIYIAGIEDMTTGFPSVEKALEGTEKPVILLSHQPDIYPKVKQEVNLILAGHTHGGQVNIPPFGALIVPSRYGKRYAQGLITGTHNKMIVTKGLGTSILPLRFNCKPEIIILEFK